MFSLRSVLPLRSRLQFTSNSAQHIGGGGGGGYVKLLGIFCDLYKHVSGKSHLPVKEYE